MRISSWAAMTRRHRGRQWHCRTIRTFNLDYVPPPQATQWPGDRSKHIRQWLGCGSSTPRYVFPISKICGALIGAPKTSRDSKKDCGEPGCPNDHRRKMLARGDEVTGGAETPLRSPTHEQRLRRTTSQSPYDSFAPASLP